MAGFTVNVKNNAQLTVGEINCLADFCEYQADDCQVIRLSDSEIIILDGYYWGIDQETLIEACRQKDFYQLSKADGHYCGVYLNRGAVTVFNDRYGARTVYFQSNDEQTLISSKIEQLPVSQLKYDVGSLYESALYRWVNTEKTLLEETAKLRARSFGHFHGGVLEQTVYWQLSKPQYNAEPLEDKVESTKQALLQNLLKARKHYRKAAIMLSGGVDSSLLAALSKEVFDDCLLVTPVFVGQANPELETAKAFAKTLDLQHLLVEIDPQALEADLALLIEKNGGPLRHYSSLAMLAMFKQIPDEYQAIIYGEAADTLFGSNAIKRLETHYGWRKKALRIPQPLLSLMKKVFPGRGSLYVELKAKSIEDVLTGLTRVQYSQSSIQALTGLPFWRKGQQVPQIWPEHLAERMESSTRHVAQEYVIVNDVNTHFKEAEIVAGLHNKHLVSPFFDQNVFDIANSLNESDYYGQEYVKPVLRELACQYYSRELIYQKKYGFPVPFVDWLNQELVHLVESAKAERDLFDGTVLNSLSIEKDYELYWFLINWQIFHQITRDNQSSELQR